MELQDNNKGKLTLQEDPQEGIIWDIPQCVHCQHNKIRYCRFYQKDRMKVDVDIFNCPNYISDGEQEEQKAKELFGMGDK